jgi:hypothetical protein
MDSTQVLAGTNMLLLITALTAIAMALILIASKMPDRKK